MGKRLMTIVGVGIVLIGAAYWYTSRPSQAPTPTPPPPSRRVIRPRQPQARTPVKPPVAVRTPERRQPQATRPPKIRSPIMEGSKGEAPEVEPPATETSEAETPKVDVPSKIPSKGAKLVETSELTPEPAEANAQEATASPMRMAKVPVPQVTVEKPYTVQVASLVVEGNALSLKKRLEKLGYQPVIHKTTAPITRYSVYTGEASSREEADQSAQRLRGDGFSSNIIQTEQGKFAVEVGSFFNQNDAIDIAHSLQKKNYTSRIISKTTPTSVHVVRVGAYEERSEAIQVVQALKEKGFAPVVVRR